jgi:histidinol-phosphatase (PHP family)
MAILKKFNSIFAELNRKKEYSFMPWTNYHSHTYYCDGAEAPENYIKCAIDKGLPAYGYSSHAPINFESDWCISDEDFTRYITDIRTIKEKHKGEIQTYLGLEVDFIPGVAGRKKHLLEDIELDYFIGSIHFVDQFADGTHWNIDTSKELFNKGLSTIFNSDFKKAATRFYELTWQMLEEEKPDIIGHLDKIKMYNNGAAYFNENDRWYKDILLNTIRKIKQSGTIVEVNTRGYYRYGQEDLYPGAWLIEKMIQQDIPIMLNSDSHAPGEIISGYKYAANELKNMGLKYLWVLLDDNWQAKPFDMDGIRL